jgi:hypothetical protein
MPRPRKTLTAEQKVQVEALAAFLTQKQIGDYFGISERTFAEMVARDEKVSAAYARGRARAIGSVAKGLILQAQDGNVNAAKFYLETQAGWTATQRHEVKVEGFEVDLVPVPESE